LVSIERFMPGTQFSAPIEMEFAPNGDMYLLEYGTAWFQGNPDARLVRIEYNAGNRKPVVAAAVDKPSGALPMRVKLSSAGTMDLDEDSLRYVWTIRRSDSSVVRRLAQANPTFTFTQPGAYTASLTATDSHGAHSTTADLRIVAGNEPPDVDIDLVSGNKSFFFPDVPVRYQVMVTDREDGSLRNGSIPASRVVVSAQTAKDWRTANGSTLATGRALIESNDCLSCHQFNRKNIGPAYSDVARKYHGDSTAIARLVRKIRQGGSGVWGTATMPAHPALTDAQASTMLAYIMSLADSKTNGPSLPTSGSYDPPAGFANAPNAALVLRAEYTDRGAHGMPAISKEKTLALRSPTLVVSTGDLSEGVSKQSVPEFPVEVTVVNHSGGSVAFKQVDLTGVSAVTFTATAPAQYQATGGLIEVHLDSPTGARLGQTSLIAPSASAAAPPTILRTALQPTSGIHDLYFVFKNPDAKGDQFMFAVLTATLESAGR
ncbi:MAG TPA: c-type cytochrome, partial [Gemmatimonadaceae bacterium]|nr:c-type cytochrome [Gemmatimonadaceae bacterium]